MRKFQTLLWLLVFCGVWDTMGQNAKYVNPFIGSSNYGATNPGAIVPQGMVSVTPFNVSGLEHNKFDKDTRWWSTPYAWENQFLTGFSHVNLSGVGCPELGIILLMPTTGKVDARPKKYGAIMKQQQAETGYYSCLLPKYGIKAEATATLRTGVSRYTFPKGQANILINLGLGLTNEQGAKIKIVNNRELEGSRMTGTFCYNRDTERPVYFVVRLSKPAQHFGVWKKMPPMKAEAAWSKTANQYKYYNSYKGEIFGDNVGAYFSFDTEDNEQIVAEVGISYVSVENARENLKVESNNFNFDATKQQALQDWNNQLNCVQISGGNLDNKKVFYTALYHMNIHPNIFNDVNGQYRKMGSFAIDATKEGNRYTVFSLWDTYRNFHPLMALLYPRLQLDFVKSMLAMYNESGWLPKWELNGKETYTMNGDPAIVVIADTYLRGLTNFDTQTAYQAMKKHATMPDSLNLIRKDNDFYLKKGYVPYRKQFDNSVSEALELYVADWSLGQFAKALGYTNDAKRFIKQSQQWVNYFDKKAFKILRPKQADGTFFKDFNPDEGKNFQPVNGFHEGTAWQYAFGMPHDMQRAIKYYGGKKTFTKKLQQIFDNNLFDMANEPDMHYPFLFNYIKGEAWRSSKQVHQLVAKYFKNTPDGIPGNDDCGTMSAWVVYAMMGLYPVAPADTKYAVTAPLFDRIEIDLNPNYYQGKKFVIIKQGKGDRIKSIFLNQIKQQSFFIRHNDIVKGGVLKIIME